MSVTPDELLRRHELYLAMDAKHGIRLVLSTDHNIAADKRRLSAYMEDVVERLIKEVQHLSYVPEQSRGDRFPELIRTNELISAYLEAIMEVHRSLML
jgi:hypothetical protein